MSKHRLFHGRNLALGPAGLLLLLLAPFSQGQTNLHFAEVIREHYARWAGGERNPLTPDKVDRLVIDPNIKGPEAAALATIHRKFGSGKNKKPVTREVLLEEKELKLLEKSYLADLKHINSAPRDLFSERGPSLDGLHQGRLGDCFVVSAIGCDVARNPAQVRHLFVEHPDGAIDVRFPLHPVHIPRLSDAEIALGSTAQQQGLWLNILEKAAGIVREKTSKKGEHDPEGIDFIAHGGDARFTIRLLTGHEAEYQSLHPHGKQAPKNPVAHCEEILQVALGHHRLMCASTSNKATVPPGMAKGHDYGVLGYDHGSRMVEVWNPWGNKFEPRGKPGIQNGYHTEGGRFQIPLHDFCEVFGGIYFETDKPARK